MELPAITQPLGSPDVFWAALSPVFNRVPGQTRGSPAKRIQYRAAHFRTNLNYNLIMHRRLVVDDASLLVSREMTRLLAADQGAPEYRDFLSGRAIVPALRSSVTSFSELAEVMLRNRQYQDLGPEMLRRSAQTLDDAKPQVAYTTFEQNQQLTHALVSDKLLRPSFWTDVGIGQAAQGVVEYVPDARKRNGSEFYRATEFWEFADVLDQKKEFAAAQRIRAQISTLSLGVMATNLNLHSVYPASFADCVDRVFGTSRPWHTQRDGVFVRRTSIVETDLGAVQKDVKFLASFLMPSDIWEIRETQDYGAFLDHVEKADTLEPTKGGTVVLDAMRDYHRFLEAFMGARFQGRLDEWRRLRSAARWIKRTAGPVPFSVGVMSSVATSYIPMPSSDALTLSLAPASLVSVCLYLFNRHITRSQEALDVSSRGSVGALARPTGSLAVELYGPVQLSDWGEAARLAEVEDPGSAAMSSTA